MIKKHTTNCFPHWQAREYKLNSNKEPLSTEPKGLCCGKVVRNNLPEKHFGDTYSESLKDLHTSDTLIALLEICPKEMIGNADLGTTVLFQV